MPRLKDLDPVHSAAELIRRTEKRAMREMLSPSVQDLLKEAMPTTANFARQFEQAQRDDLVRLARDSGALGAMKKAEIQFAHHVDLASHLRSAMQEIDQKARELYAPIVRPIEEAFREIHRQQATLFEGMSGMTVLRSAPA